VLDARKKWGSVFLEREWGGMFEDALLVILMTIWVEMEFLPS